MHFFLELDMAWFRLLLLTGESINFLFDYYNMKIYILISNSKFTK